MKRDRPSGFPWPIVLAAIGLGLACNSTSLAPFQPEVTNATDNFQLQATGVTSVTDNLGYTWQNTGTSANVNQSTTVTGGSATLIIRDATGTQVYSRDLALNGTFPTSTGVTGNWKIRLELNNYSGTLNFRVQKP